MGLEILLVDEEDILSVTKDLLERNSDYQVDCVKNTERAKQLMDEKSYDVLIIEPFVRGVPLDFHAPTVEVIRRARKKNIPVIISSTQSEGYLLPLWGLVKNFDYQAVFEKPYEVKEMEPFLRGIAG